MKTLLAISTAMLLSLSALAAQLPLSTQQASDFAVTSLPYEVDGRFHKWESSPTISCIGEAVKFRPVVEEFVREMNVVLNGLPVIPRLGPDNDLKADIVLVIDTPTTIAKIKRQENSLKDWRWHPSWNADGSLKRFVLYENIAHYQTLDGSPEKRMIYVALLRGLGIGGAKAYSNSSVWGSFNLSANALILWDNDKQLIRFAYENLPSSANRETIRKIVKKEWK